VKIARLEHETDFDGWRSQARALLAEGVRPEDAVWRVGDADGDLFGALTRDTPAAPPSKITVPKSFLSDAQTAICHRDPARFDLLYRLLWRVQTERGLMANAVDDDVHRLHGLTKAIRRDIHKMHAFVRFREVKGEEETFVAWFEPEHRITERGTPFFMRRFANMRWSILTPDRCAHWDRKSLTFTEGADRTQAPEGDELEDLWRGYFRSIFNPARLKVKAMTSEMPKKYWKNLPEAELIAPLIASARAMERGMVEAAPTVPKREADYAFAEPELPPADALAALRQRASACALCDHACHATQTVFGEGALDARLMVVGEQPGDREDIAGRPFIGPAGEVFDTALAEAGLSRNALYVTNAVKHFRFTPKGKKRIHQAPRVGHIDHCRWWLDAERRLVKPDVTLAMGGTAIRALHGKPIPVGDARNGFTCLDGGEAFASLHPAAVLRQSDAGAKDRAFRSLVDDLKRAKQMVAASAC
jgi:DNA polymerase